MAAKLRFVSRVCRLGNMRQFVIRESAVGSWFKANTRCVGEGYWLSLAQHWLCVRERKEEEVGC